MFLVEEAFSEQELFFHYNKTEVCGVKCLAHAHATYYNCILCYDV